MANVILSAAQLTDNPGQSKKPENKNYLKFSVVRKMIFKFLTRDRIIMVPTRTPKFSELELSQQLNISLTQLRRVQTKTYYKQIIGQINLSLIDLYCNTRWTKGIDND
jgi:hypothetical protein